jgi:hypothetical protein
MELNGSVCDRDQVEATPFGSGCGRAFLQGQRCLESEPHGIYGRHGTYGNYGRYENGTYRSDRRSSLGESLPTSRWEEFERAYCVLANSVKLLDALLQASRTRITAPCE